MRNIMQIRNLILLFGAILIVNCAGNAPSVGEEIVTKQSGKYEVIKILKIENHDYPIGQVPKES